MAISWDAHTLSSAIYSSTGTQNTTHAVGASARAAVVVITQDGSVSDEVSGVTFDGVAMSRPIAFDTNDDENGAVYLYFLDDITGQGGNVTVAMTTSANADKRLSVHTFNTQGAEYSVVCSANSAYATTANPTTTISGLSSGTTYLGVMGVHSSLNAFPNTPATGWTSTGYEDLGVRGWGQGYLTNTTSGVTSLTASWTASADGYVIIAAALSEGPRVQKATADATVSVSADAAPAGVTKPATATNATMAVTADATPGGTAKSTIAQAVTVSLTAASDSFLLTDEYRDITGPEKSYGTITGALGQLGSQTHTATASATVSPTAAAAASRTQVATATGVTVSPTAAATPAAITKSTAATGVTVGPTAAATPGAVTKPATATGVTVSPTTTAVPAAITDQATADATVSVTAAAAATVAKSSAATGVTVSPTAAATPAAMTKSTTATAVMVSPSTAATPQPITDTATADATVSPTTSATPATMTKSVAATGVTVSPTPNAISGAVTKPATATGATVAVSATASATVSKSSTADVTVSPVAQAAGQAWRQRWFKPDALLTLSGLTGTVSEIQDSPTSPDANALDPVGGAVTVRISFENHGQELRTNTGDQVIRVLTSTP